MSSPYPFFIDYLRVISLFLGLPLLISGLVGNCLCIVVFLSLKTFRHNSCSFYLTCTCAVNIGHLLTSFFTRLLVNGFDIDWTVVSVFYCKFRWILFQFFILTTLTSLCLATWDQYVSTSHRESLKRFSNLRIAHRLIIGTAILWLFHGISFTFTTDIQYGICLFTNSAFHNYFRRFFLPVLLMLLPISIMITLSILSVRNIRKMHRQTNADLGRRALDRQLTKMLLTQVVFIAASTVPFITHYTYILNTTFPTANALLEQQLIAAMLNIVWHAGYSVKD